MDQYASTNGDKVNVLLLNIEGVGKAKSFKKGELNSVRHGGISSLPEEFQLAYIPHHVIIGTVSLPCDLFTSTSCLYALGRQRNL